MWSLDEIRVEVVEADDAIAIIEIDTPAGRLELLGSLSRIGRTLFFRNAHVQGLGPGALGRSGLNAIGRKLLVEADVDAIVIEGSTRTTGAREGRRPRPIRFPR